MRVLKHLPALFEGLAGTGADIDAVFQIEDELNQSALDMDDQSEIIVSPPVGPSSVTYGERRRSTAGQISPTTSGLAVNIKSTNSDASADFGHSRRRSGAFPFIIDSQTPGIQPSPLAQIYQPLVLVDDESNGGDEMSMPLSSTSFVPRRRLPSMTRVRRPSIEPFQPHPHPARSGGPQPAEHMAMPIPPTTVPERVEDESVLVASPGETSETSRRLMAMEERQQRIENLLVALAGELRATGTRVPKTNT